MPLVLPSRTFFVNLPERCTLRPSTSRKNRKKSRKKNQRFLDSGIKRIDFVLLLSMTEFITPVLRLIKNAPFLLFRFFLIYTFVTIIFLVYMYHSLSNSRLLNAKHWLISNQLCDNCTLWIWSLWTIEC